MVARTCHQCGKKIPSRLNHIKEPIYYFKMVQKDEEDCLYWCDWDCIKKYVELSKKKGKTAVFYVG